MFWVFKEHQPGELLSNFSKFEENTIPERFENQPKINIQFKPPSERLDEREMR